VIGSGAGAYSVESSSNTFSDVLTGTSITVSETTTDPVTVNVTRDDSTLISDVNALVSAANTVLAEIRVQTRFGVDGIGNGALAGNSAMRRVENQLRSALSQPVEGFGDLIGADVGIQVDRDGNFTFDSSRLTQAIEEDPSAVARFFGRAATTPSGVTFTSAADETQSGSYDVDVTTAATQATTARLFDGGAGAATRIGIRVGDTTATVDVEAGQSAASIITSVNDAIAAAGLDLAAEADGTGLVVRTDTWGSAGSFEINTDVAGAGTWDAVDGVNIEGTINGQSATGIGRTLSLNTLVDDDAAGLSVTVDGGLTGSLGAVDYQPGVAARVAEITTFMLGDDGTFDTAQDAQQRRIDGFNDDIERFEDLLLIREQTLRRQWSSLQTTLAQLQERGNWVLAQLGSLPQVNS
ncbi:MAG: flagellar filament capping protein FliD, partial [Actinomycetota bacterium]